MPLDPNDPHNQRIIPVGVRTVPQRFSTQLPNPTTLPRADNVAAEAVSETNDRTRFVNVQSFNVPMLPGAYSTLAVNTPAGRRALLSINNFYLTAAQAAPFLPTDEAFRIGVSFDVEPTAFDQCAIQLAPGGSVLYDQVVPQNRVYLFCNQLVLLGINIPVGIVVGNFVG